MKALILGAAVLLAGCSALPGPILLPPEALVQECPAPVPGFKTNGELANYVLSLQGALQSCNDDKAALREWMKEPK